MQSKAEWSGEVAGEVGLAARAVQTPKPETATWAAKAVGKRATQSMQVKL